MVLFAIYDCMVFMFCIIRLENLPNSIEEMRRVWDRIESVISSVQLGSSVSFEELSTLLSEAISLKVGFI